MRPKITLLFTALLTLCLLLAHVDSAHANAAQEIAETQQKTAQTYDRSVSAAMETLISTPVFTEAATVGTFIAVAGFAPVLIGAAKMYNIGDEVNTDALLNGTFSLFLIVLLLGVPTDRGRLLAKTILGVNDIANELSSRIIDKAAGEDGVNAVAKEVVKANAESVAEKAIIECSELPEKGSRDGCFRESINDVTAILDRYKDETWAQNSSQRLLERLNTKADLDTNLVYGVGQWFSQTASSVGNFIYGETLKALCYVIGDTFVIAVEHMKVLMAMVAPIFVGLHMVPLFRGFFTTWLKNFLMLEFALMLYNVLISLVALTMINATDEVSLVFPFFIAAMSIVFALVLAGGGGISLFTQAASATTGTVSAVRRAFK